MLTFADIVTLLIVQIVICQSCLCLITNSMIVWYGAHLWLFLVQILCQLFSNNCRYHHLSILLYVTLDNHGGSILECSKTSHLPCPAIQPTAQPCIEHASSSPLVKNSTARVWHSSQIFPQIFNVNLWYNIWLSIQLIVNIGTCNTENKDCYFKLRS